MSGKSVETHFAYVAANGSEAVASIWGSAPKVKGYVETLWLLDEEDRRFVLVGRPRGKKGTPHREVARILPSQSVGFDRSGNLVLPRSA